MSIYKEFMKLAAEGKIKTQHRHRPFPFSRHKIKFQMPDVQGKTGDVLIPDDELGQFVWVDDLTALEFAKKALLKKLSVLEEKINDLKNKK